MAALQAGFAVYIDEAGDPGFRFLHADGSKGSSEWFIVSAAIVRTESHEAFLDEVAYQSRTFGVGQAGRLHFKEMEHYRRIAWLENLQSCPILATSVITHKHSLERTEPDSWRLYFFTVKYLLERVSSICRENASSSTAAVVIFSNSGSLPFWKLQNYVRERCDAGELDPEVISSDPDRMIMSTENKFPGLQIADAIASSIAQGLEYDRNFHTLEHRYMKILKPKIYKAKGDENYRDSGMKLHPYPLREHMEYDQRVLWMRKYYW